ncbi:MAG: hypothetical protein AB1813_03260 [Verrucomicrobiota bacterium]
MAESFVPLVPSGSLAVEEATPFRLKVLPQKTSAPFHPLAAPAPAASAPAEPTPTTPHGPPRVTLHREGNQVTQISIQCSCGQTIELACVY